MYAVIKTGGKQYKVAPGEKLKVERYRRMWAQV
jgi:ribosomal protein L21